MGSIDNVEISSVVFLPEVLIPVLVSIKNQGHCLHPLVTLNNHGLLIVRRQCGSILPGFTTDDVNVWAAIFTMVYLINHLLEALKLGVVLLKGVVILFEQHHILGGHHQCLEWFLCLLVIKVDIF